TAFKSAGKRAFCRVGPGTCAVEPLRGTRGIRPVSGKLALFAVPLIVTLAYATGARAADDEDVAPEVTAAGTTAPEDPSGDPPAPVRTAAGRPTRDAAGYYPPAVDGPA